MWLHRVCLITECLVTFRLNIPIQFHAGGLRCRRLIKLSMGTQYWILISVTYLVVTLKTVGVFHICSMNIISRIYALHMIEDLHLHVLFPKLEGIRYSWYGYMILPIRNTCKFVGLLYRVVILPNVYCVLFQLKKCTTVISHLCIAVDKHLLKSYLSSCFQYVPSYSLYILDFLSSRQISIWFILARMSGKVFEKMIKYSACIPLIQ